MYSAAFGISFYLYKSGIKLNYLLGLSFLFKFIFLFSIPELSQDFYRFIWDGLLTTKGINPYSFTPRELIESGLFTESKSSLLLYEKMGELSQTNYSTYPPFAQAFYSLSYYLSGSNLMYNVIFLRLIHLIAEVGIVFFSIRLLKKINLPKENCLLFTLNPLVILESSFSLHFEVVMLCFLALGLYYLYLSKLYLSAFGFAAAVASKMLPLMFLPLIFPYFNKKSQFLNKDQVFNYLRFTAVLILSLILAYSFWWTPELIIKNSKTLALYFTSFEFNASFYYVFRWIGYQWSGYNMIGVLGKLLSISSLFVILFLSFKKRKINYKTLLNYMLFASTAYYLLSTTVHPWYIILPLFLSIFTRFKYMIAWSWLIFLSYSAYKIDGVEENFWLIGVQYIIVVGIMTYELVLKKKLIL
jgi:hypothetical protein